MRRPLVTLERLRQVLDYDREFGIFTWKISPCNNTPKGSLAGGRTKDGYVKIAIDRRYYRAHRLAWFYVYGEWPRLDVDHKDTVRSHNWIDNLREADDSQNGANAGRPSNNTSGYKGVAYHARQRRWEAYIVKDGRQRHLGYFESANEAHAAYYAEAVRLFGEFARAA